MSKLRIQQYMEKHKLTPLFEDLMNKVLHDQPDDPLVYLIKSLYKKAALPIPKDLRPGTLRRSSPERIGRRSKSPEKSQTWAVGSGPDLVDRSYDKPWLTGKKKTREERGDSPTKHATLAMNQSRSPSKSPVRKGPAPLLPLLVTPSQTDEVKVEIRSGKATLNVQHDRREDTLDGLLKITPKALTQRRKQKADWVSDTKVTTTTFDELFEADHAHQEHAEKQAAGRHRREENPDITRAWARNIGLDDGEDINYRSRGYTGPRCSRNDTDPLAGELQLAKDENVEESSYRVSKPRNARQEAKKHREDLEKLLQDTDKVSLDSGFNGQEEEDVEDDAIELLEDPDELKREGVTKISKSGHKLSRILRQRQEEANVKLNINLYTGRTPSLYDDGNHQYGDYYESDLERPPTGMSFQSNRYSEFSPDVSDDEFESVSQVVGPRKPVWSQPDSDGDTQRQDYSRTLPQPARKKTTDKFSATAPVRFADKPPHPMKSVDSEKDLYERTQAWESVQKDLSESPPDVRESVKSSRSYSGQGWNIPDGTEVSLTTQWTAGPFCQAYMWSYSGQGWNIPDGTEVSLTTQWTAGTSARVDDGPPKAY